MKLKKPTTKFAHRAWGMALHCRKVNGLILLPPRELAWLPLSPSKLVKLITNSPIKVIIFHTLNAILMWPFPSQQLQTFHSPRSQQHGQKKERKSTALVELIILHLVCTGGSSHLLSIPFILIFPV